MADLLLSSCGSHPLKAAAAGDGAPSKPPASQQADSLGRRLCRGLKSANDALLYLCDGLSPAERERERIRDERRAVLRLRMKTAESFRQWQAAAQELDVVEGNEAWKHDTATGDYQPQLIEQRRRALDDARRRCDIRAMMHLVRTALSRDLGGMGDVDLYRHSYVGTKKLIEGYVDSAIQTIDAVVAQGAAADSRDLLEAMLFSRQSFGRSALLLSGGGTFGMTHIGVLKALFEARLLPRIVSGASAGSIVCAVVCTRTDDEIPALIREFPYGDLAVFDDGDDDGGLAGLLGHLRRLLTEGSWSDMRPLTRVMRDLTGDLTFQEAYNRTRRILNICVSTASVYELPRLLNYVTAPNVLIWSAVAASCSVPLFFSSAPLLVKDPVSGEHHPWNPTPQRFIDGSVDNDLPMTRLAEMFNVNHFIVSQVNPHVVPFLAKDDHLSPDAGSAGSAVSGSGSGFGFGFGFGFGSWSGSGSGSASGPDSGLDSGPDSGPDSGRAPPPPPPPPPPRRADEFDWGSALATLAKDEALHRLQFMADLGVLPNLMTKCRSILSQKYSGDVTILPEIAMHDLPRLMSNPTPDFMLRCSALGERATWPKLSRIRDRCAIELALDRAVHRLRTRVVFSESQRDLRGLGLSEKTAAAAAAGGYHYHHNHHHHHHNHNHHHQQQQQQQQQQHQQHQQHQQQRVRMSPVVPCPPTPPSAPVAGAGGLGPRRRRRRSGGSVHMPSHAASMMLDSCAAAADGGGGGGYEAGGGNAFDCSADARRHGGGGSPVVPRKPRLKRASRSHVHVPQSRVALAAAAAAAASSSSTEQQQEQRWRRRRRRQDADYDAQHDTAEDDAEHDALQGLLLPTWRWTPRQRRREEGEGEDAAATAATSPWPQLVDSPSGMDSPSGTEAGTGTATTTVTGTATATATATSPTDDVETSEQGHSSDAYVDADADAEQATEECDPEPLEGPSKRRDDDAGEAEERAAWGVE